MSIEREKILKEIQKQKELLEELGKMDNDYIKKESIRDLNEITSEDKILFFDKMYKSALSELSDIEEKGYKNDDSEHYVWEEYITILSKNDKKFWKYYNSLYK